MAAHVLRRDELLAGVARFRALHPQIDDDETQGRAGDFAKQLQSAIKISRDAFSVAKRPFIEGGKAVDLFFRSVTDPLEIGLADVRRPMTDYALRLEAAERQRREDAAAKARAEAADAQRKLREQFERDRAAERDAQTARLAALPPQPVSRTEPDAPTVEHAIALAQQADIAARAASARSADLTRNRGDAGSVSSLRELWEVELVDLSQVPMEFLLFNESAARRAVAGGKRREIPGCRVFATKHVQTR